MTNWTIGDVSGSTTLTDNDHLYPTHINELRTATAALQAYTINVKDYGAVGDGTTDDTAAIQAAVDAAFTNREIVFFPRGVYKITDTIDLYTGSQLQGMTRFQSSMGYGTSPKASFIKFRPSTEKDLFNITDPNGANGGFNKDISIVGLYMQGPAGFGGVYADPLDTNGRYAINILAAIYCNFQDIGIEGFQTGIYCDGTINNRFCNIYIGTCTVCDVLYSTATTDVWDQCTFYNAPIGIQANDWTVDVRFFGCLFEQISTYGVSIPRETQNMEFHGCYSENVPSANTAGNAMFKVGTTGTSLAAENHITVIGGKYTGRDDATSPTWMDFDYSNGAMISMVNVSRYVNIFKDTANTRNTSIVVAGMAGGSWTNFEAGTGGKKTGMYPNGVIDSGTNDQVGDFA